MERPTAAGQSPAAVPADVAALHRGDPAIEDEEVRAAAGWPRPRELRSLPAGAIYGGATGIAAGVVVAALSLLLPIGVGTLADVLRLVVGLAVAGTAAGALTGLSLDERPASARGGRPMTHLQVTDAGATDARATNARATNARATNAQAAAADSSSSMASTPQSTRRTASRTSSSGSPSRPKPTISPRSR